MFWLDVTHLASFRDASLWPLYMFLGNQSKYECVWPTSGACHHVAYLPKVCIQHLFYCSSSCSLILFQLPDAFQEWFRAKVGSVPSSDILTHCHCELMHSSWRLLLDQEFLHAYIYGIVIKCTDGVTQCVFPQIFTYSVDYPEK